MVPKHVSDRVRCLAERIDCADDHLDVAGYDECGEGSKFWRFTTQVNCTSVEPCPIMAARAILGSGMSGGASGNASGGGTRLTVSLRTPTLGRTEQARG